MATGEYEIFLGAVINEHPAETAFSSLAWESDSVTTLSGKS